MNQELIDNISAMVFAELEQRDRNPAAIPVGVSNRHVHLSQAHMDELFKIGFTKLRDLSQAGQFVIAETVILAGPKGTLEGVRVVGPARTNSQVELSVGDAYKIGVIPLVRESGDIQGTPGITVIGSSGSVQLQEGVIVAKRHLHMKPEEADLFRVNDGDVVEIKCHGDRSLAFNQVIVRVNPNYTLEFHIDFEEANAAGLKQGDMVTLVHTSVESRTGKGMSQVSGKQQVKYPEEYSLITEEMVAKVTDHIYVSPRGIITPLARDMIRENGIKVIRLE